MIPTRNNEDSLIIHCIDEPVSPIDSPRSAFAKATADRPASLQIELERLWLPDTLRRMFPNIRAKFFDALNFLWIRFLKIQIIFVCRFGKPYLHRYRSTCTVLPFFASLSERSRCLRFSLEERR